MLRNYLKTALKVFLRRRFFTGVSLFGISFTLTVLMVVTSGLDHVFGVHPPEVYGDRMLVVTRIAHRQVRDGGRSTSSMDGNPSYRFLDRHARTLPDVEAVSIARHSLETVVSYQSGERSEIQVRRADGAFWRVMAFRFLEGGPFTAEDDRDANPVAVINAATRERLFGDGPALGRTIELNAQGYRVVGVVANVPMLRLLSYADAWVPIHAWPSTADLETSSFVGGFQAVILASDAADLPRIRADFQASLAGVEFPDPGAENTLEAAAETLFEQSSRGIYAPDMTGIGQAQPRMLLGSIVGLMLLFMVLPTLNLVNLNLSRVLERASEVGVRKAFGASSRAVVGQLVTENVLITLVGGVLGFGLSVVALEALGDSGLVPYAEFRMNLRVFLYGLATALFFGVFSGVYPAWRMSRLHPVQALRGGQR